jgi:hypothetical protein
LLGDGVLNTFTVSFFGHRIIENALKIEGRLEQLIQALLRDHEYVEFLVGRDGEFDQLVSSAIRRCKREYRSDNSAHIWVLPYVTAEFRDNEESFRDYYDEIEVCEAATGCHYKNAHQTRNRAMVDRSDLVVFCIQHTSGGAWQTMKYAKKQGKPYINLKEQLEEAE